MSDDVNGDGMDAGENLLVLGSEHWRVGVLPQVGASLAFGQIADEDGWVDLLRPTAPADRYDPARCASYVLSPWSNRVRDGVLHFEGRTWQLRINQDDGTAIHGAARDYPWRVTSRDGASCTLEFDSRDVVGVNFPWRFLTRVTYTVTGRRLGVDTHLVNCDTEPFPAGFGHHPYFMRTLAGPADEVRLQVPCASAFRLSRCIPDGPPVPIEPRIDFRQMRPLGTEFVDDCLTARDASAPIRMLYPRSRREVQLVADELYSAVVVYVPQEGKPFFAVEPVTNANDGFSLFERGVPASGIFVLEPGQERSAAFHLDLVD